MIGARGGDPGSVPAEHTRIDTLGMAAQRPQLPPVERIPDFDRLVIAGRGNPVAARAESTGINFSGMANQIQHLLPADHIPYGEGFF